MSRTQRIVLVFLLLIAIGLWTAVGYDLSRAWNRPLGPALELPSETASPIPPSETASRVPSPGPSTTAIPGPPTLTPYQAGRGAPLCGGPRDMTLLAVGSDTRAPGYLYGLADVIRLVRIDFVDPGISVLEFPRDLWVDIPEISAHYGITKGKLNQAYLYGNPGMGYYDGPGEGPGLLARTMDMNFGARPDRYVAINMQTFVDLVNAVGGLNIYLPYDVDGRAADQETRADLYFAQGYHHLGGKEALMLARLRKGENTDRGVHQNIILCALRDELLDPRNIQNLPAMVDAFDGAIQTDLTPAEISALTCLAPHISAANVRFVSFPPSQLTGARIYDRVLKKYLFIWEADFATLRLYTTAFQAGLWPEPPDASITPVPVTPEDQPDTFACP
jgi:LCP family protein required for cell wall assembly